MSTYGAVQGKDPEDGLMGQGKALAMQGANAAAGKVDELRQKAYQGHWSWRLFGVISGVLMILSGIAGVFTDLSSLAVASALLDLYLILFGCVAIVLETSLKYVPPSFSVTLRANAKFLATLAGRGLFYVFCGSLMMSAGGLALILGIFVVVVGVLIFIAGRMASHRLKAVATTMTTEAEVRRAFNRFDEDGNGSLDAVELAKLCKELGSPLSHAALEAALVLLDADGNGTIEYGEFLAWWQSKVST